MSAVKRDDEQYNQLVQIGSGLVYIQEIKKKIGELTEKANRADNKRKKLDLVHPSRYIPHKTADDVKSKLYSKKIDKNSKKADILNITLNVLICVLAIGVLVALNYFAIKHVVIPAFNKQSSRWWVLFIPYTEERGRALYWLSMCIWLLIIGITMFCVEKDDGETGLLISSIILMVIGAVCFVLYCIALDLFLLWSILLVIAYLILGIAHWCILGFINLLPYLIPIGGTVLLCWLFFKFELYDLFYIGIHTELKDGDVTKNNDYLAAVEYDRKVEPLLKEQYKRAYKIAYDKNEEYNKLVDEEFEYYDKQGRSLVLQCAKFSSMFEKMCKEYNLLHEDDCTIETVYALIYLIDHHRADSVKEALCRMDERKFWNQLLQEIKEVQRLQKISIAAQIMQIEETRKIGEQLNKQLNSIGGELIRLRNEINTNMAAISRENEAASKRLSKSIEKSSVELTNSIKDAKDALSSTVCKSTRALQETIKPGGY